MTVIEGRPQHMEALDRANVVRLARARVRREVACGEVTVREVLEARRHRLYSGIRLRDLLGWQQRWGDQRVTRVLDRAGLVGEIGDLSDADVRRLGVSLP